jgi:hypothetical protein
MTAAEKELLEAWRSVANAKLVEYRRQAWRLGMLMRQGLLERTVVVDHMWTVAIAHGLLRSLGQDRVTAILAEALADADFRPMYSEVGA